MMDAVSAGNFLSYSAQILFVVALGALLPGALRMDAAGVHYAYWRGLAVLCLALPWLQSRIAASAGTAAVQETFRAAENVADGAAASVGGFSPSAASWGIVGGVLAAGIAIRLVWLGTGLLKLRALRRSTEPAARGAEHDELQQILGTRADVRYADGLAQPVTFGLLAPVVLLPSTLKGHPADVQRAVIAHELLHVQRRDWAWVLVEEVVRAVFWFHPAVWWLISRIQLAREEVVDALAVLVTGQRRTYVEALLAFADDTPLAPATAFARRRHLYRRMRLISREAVMSSNRIVASCAVMALVIAAESWYVVRAFPLVEFSQSSTLQEKPGPLEQIAIPVTPENPIPRRVHVVPPEYPAEGRTENATGFVRLRVTLDQSGKVTETRVIGLRVRMNSGEVSLADVAKEDAQQFFATSPVSKGPEIERVVDAFIRAAASAVEQWRYDPPYQAPISFPILINFSLGSATAETFMPPPPPPAPTGPTAPRPGMRTPPPPPPAPSETELDARRRLFQKLQENQATGWTAEGALRVGENIKPPTKIRDVKPAYPPIAKASSVQGVVIVEARIDEQGYVSHARVLRSIPLLDQTALDAVKQWQFTPTLLNGVPVPIIMTLAINFSLSQ